jgi:hypothetical protein
MCGPKMRASELEEKNRELTQRLEIARGQICFLTKTAPSQRNVAARRAGINDLPADPRIAVMVFHADVSAVCLVGN